MFRRALAPLLCGVLTACGVPESEPFGPELDGLESPIEGVACESALDVVCSGDSPVYTALLRVGADGSRFGEIAQTFTVGVDGLPTELTLKLRLLRDLPENSQARLRVVVREASAGVPLTGPVLATASRELSLLTRGVARDEVLAFEAGALPLDSEKTYAAVVFVDPDPLAPGELHVGVAAHATETFAEGEAFVRSGRIGEAPAFRLPNGNVDLSFALSLRGGLALPCGAGGVCLEGLSCVQGSCAVPTCNDGVRNGSESDVDCGGSCAKCVTCGVCAGGSDCSTGICEGGRCITRNDLTVHWRNHCHGDGGGRQYARLSNLAAGRYRVTALSGGATVWDPPYNSSRGYFWRIQGCTNFAVPGLATSQYYTSASAAFAGLNPKTAEADWGGGTLSCHITDSACDDNHGEIKFRLERLCD